MALEHVCATGCGNTGAVALATMHMEGPPLEMRMCSEPLLTVAIDVSENNTALAVVGTG